MRKILVTGGTGSFGQAFVKHILDRHPDDAIIVFSRDEQKQHEMRLTFGSERVDYILGDVRDRDALDRAFTGIDCIVHAAALKQVGAAEHNPAEAVKTNVLGSANVAAAAAARGIARAIEVSTDKAVHPANVYGATKMIADRLFVTAGFSVARLGNFASRGSVVPYFKKLVAEGAAELPITNARMTRFWLTLPQAVEFVLASLERMQGGEIYVPRAPSVRIVDIATAIAPSLRQKIIGIKAGEKLHETLLSRDEASRAHRFSDHYVVGLRPDATGAPRVEEGFEYSSERNEHFLTVEELRKQIDFTP